MEDTELCHKLTTPKIRRQPNALQVASKRTKMEEAVQTLNILVSKFHIWSINFPDWSKSE